MTTGETARISPLARLLRGLVLAGSLGLAIFLVVRAQGPAAAETTAPTAPSSSADPVVPAVDVVADPLSFTAEEEPRFDFINAQNEFLWSSKNPVITPGVGMDPYGFLPEAQRQALERNASGAVVPEEFLHGSKSLRLDPTLTKP